MTYYPCDKCGYDGSHPCMYGGYEFGCGHKSCECVCTPRDKRYWAEIRRLEGKVNRLNKQLGEAEQLVNAKRKENDIEALKRAIERLEVTP